MEFLDLESHLRSYKYNNKSLEETMKLVLHSYNVKEYVINNKSYEYEVQEISQILVGYKFSQGTTSGVISDLNAWFAQNAHVFNILDLTDVFPKDGWGDS